MLYLQFSNFTFKNDKLLGLIFFSLFFFLSYKPIIKFVKINEKLTNLIVDLLNLYENIE
jgi:hypothetical protein